MRANGTGSGLGAVAANPPALQAVDDLFSAAWGAVSDPRGEHAYCLQSLRGHRYMTELERFVGTPECLKGVFIALLVSQPTFPKDDPRNSAFFAAIAGSGVNRQT